MSTKTTVENIRTNWPEAAGPQMECLLLIQRVARLLKENAQEVVKPLGLSFTEFEVLAALRASPPPHVLLPTALYDAMLISSGGLTKVLKELEVQKLISRPAHKGDKRQRPVALLPKGGRLAESGLARIIEADQLAVSGAGVTNGQYRETAQLLIRMADALETAEIASFQVNSR